MNRAKFIMATFCMMLIEVISGQEIKLWEAALSATYSHFEQQIKAKVGDTRGQKISDITEFGISMEGNRRIIKNLRGGVYVIYDLGNRSGAKFDGFDSTGITRVKDQTGGIYKELWLGPYLQYQWKLLNVDLGYGALGIRQDNGRSDIKNSNGMASGDFLVNPKLAWYVGMGSKVEISSKCFVVIKVQYRVRYYNTRDGEPLMNNMEHGTQNISPYTGILYKF